MTVMRRRLLAWFLGGSAGMLVSGFACGKEESMRAFREEVLDIMHQRFPGTPAEPGEDDAKINVEVRPMSLRFAVNLGNL